MNIAVSYHFDEANPQIWSTPLGLVKAFERAGHTVSQYGFEPTACNLSRLIGDADKFDLIMFCLAGPSPSFDQQLGVLRSKTKTKIFMELGDDLLQSMYHANRLSNLDAMFPPDLRCHNHYVSSGLMSVWLPCWCDELVFFKTPKVRQNLCITSCGDRPMVNELKGIYGDRFINERVWNYDNTEFFNTGTISYQFARYDEVTRRLFEVGGCCNAILTNRLSLATGIHTLFVEDRDIAYFSTPDECLQKMNRLFTDEDYRTTLATNLYEKIKRKHLISHRVDTILETFDDLK